MKSHQRTPVARKRVELDRLNRRILTELQLNARISNIELAERVGLSASACLKRVQALEAVGCIQGYLMAANIDRIAHSVQAYFLIHLQDTRQETTRRFETYLASASHIVDCMRVGGAPDYIALVVGSDVPHLNALLNEMMDAGLNVERINLQIVLSRPKWFVGYPLSSLTWKEHS